MIKHYGIPINEDTLVLIKHINGGVLPANLNPNRDGIWRYFCFSIDAKGKTHVLKNPIRTWDSLWVNDWKIKNDRTLLG